MNRRVFGIAAAGCALPATVAAQRRWGGTPSGYKPPVGKTAEEKKILAVLDKMVSENRLYLAVPATNGRMLRLLAESAGAKNAVEVGTSTGYSGLWLSLALQKTGGRLTTFEIDPGRAAEAKRHFSEAGVDGLVKVVLGDAHQNVKTLKDPIDLVFLDADKEGYESYLKTLLPLVRPGGVITADNVEMAPDYSQAVTTNPDLDTVFFDQFAVTLKKR